jgi:hypothetical protein
MMCSGAILCVVVSKYAKLPVLTLTAPALKRGTVLTLLFLPALYVAWFRIKEPVQEALAADGHADTPVQPNPDMHTTSQAA